MIASRPLSLLLLTLVLCAFAASVGVARAEPTIRVLLGDVTDAVTLRLDGAHRGYVDESFRFEATLGLTWPVSVQGGMLTVDGVRLGRSLRFESASGIVEYEGASYRGALALVAHDDRLLVLNHVGLESYLRGVVPSEMPAEWPLEALKAQAVAARSYTLANLKPGEPFDVCATTDCQVYRGMRVEHERADEAIALTRGVVLTYGDAFARTYYHSDSGGAVASSREVWGYSAPYLVARADVAARTPHRQWEYRLDAAALTASLRTYGIDVGGVRAVRIVGYSESGRAERAEVIGDRGRATVQGAALRNILRGAGLKSTRITMLGDLVARGDGWGHGVGMSQYGAMTMAASGYGFDQILAFYYPGTLLSGLEYRFRD
jgi:stage II sporulation protein D